MFPRSAGREGIDREEFSLKNVGAALSGRDSNATPVRSESRSLAFRDRRVHLERLENPRNAGAKSVTGRTQGRRWHGTRVALPLVESSRKEHRSFEDRLNGYRMPADDAGLTKEADIPLGAEARKRLWPNAIWPGAIPGRFPSGILIPSDLTVVEGAQVTSDFSFFSERGRTSRWGNARRGV
jgi:hypothetical protein